MKKYQQTDKWFRLPDGSVVRPFDGESIHQVSWSHGFTHVRDEYGEINWCGQDWFERNAIEI